MATATVEEVQLLKTLRWWDGFVIALCNPGFLLGSLGFTLGIFGVGRLDDPVGRVGGDRDAPGLDLLRAGDDVRPPQRRHLAVRPRGLAQVHDAGRAAVGVRLLDRLVGRAVDLRQDHRRPGAPPSGGPPRTCRSASCGNTSRCPSFIAIGCIIFVWAFNIFGLRPAVWFTYACAGLLMVPLALFIIVPYFTGDWHSSNVHATFTGPWGGIKLALVYMFILAWSAYGTEACATFAPEYKSIDGHPPGAAHRRPCSCCSCACCCRSASAASTACPGRHDRRRGPVLHAGDEHARRPRRRQLLHDLHHRQPAAVDDLLDG